MSEKVTRIRVELDEIRPKIWRRFSMPLSLTLSDLARTVLRSMGWLSYHLWEFQIRGQSFANLNDWDGDDFDWVQDASKVQIADLIELGITQMKFEYDFGDGWRHSLRLGAVSDADPNLLYPYLLAGENQCPPEDVGGYGGFEHFLEVINDPKHPEHEELFEWHGGGFDPTYFDLERRRKAIGLYRVTK